jgi:enoyl-CoA hydratase
MAIELSFSNAVAILTLNRPDALNALNLAQIAAIEAAVQKVSDSDARALIVLGAGGKAFCAGADIKELAAGTLLEHRRDLEAGQRAFSRLHALPMVSIALLDGYAFGGGLELALACTFRLAGRRAKLGLPEIKLGLVPGYGGTQRLARLIGESRALELILSGRTVAAEEALQLGIVNRLLESATLEAALEYAAAFTGFSRLASRFALDAVRRGSAVDVERGLYIERDQATLAFQTEDAAEGMAAFMEKRMPVFKDR